MYSPLPTRRKLLGMTVETTAGTAASVTAALTGDFQEIKLEPTGFFDAGKRMPAGLYAGKVASTLGPQKGKLSFKHRWSPQDAFVTFLLAAGYKVTSTTYAPISDLSQRNYYTVKVWESGHARSIVGAQLTGKMTLADGKPAEVAWTGDGVWAADDDESMPSQSAQTALPYICRGLTLTVGGVAVPYTSQIEIDLGNVVDFREDITSSTFLAHAVIMEREPKMSLNPEARLKAGYDAFGKLLGGATAAFSCVLTSGAHTMTIAAPAVQIQAIADEDRNKRMALKTDFDLMASSGDDELTFTET